MKALFAALVKAQGEIGGALKDSTNPHFKSKYADLASVVEAIKPIAAKHGLGFIQVFHERESGIAIETVIIHESGEQYSTNPLPLPVSKQDAQGYGSAITYARRYSLQTAFGVPSEDDDGNAAARAAVAPVVPHEVSIDRTMVMKSRSAIQEHIANDRPLGVKEEWQHAHEQGEEFQAAIWSGLTTPERDYVRKANTPRKS